MLIWIVVFKLGIPKILLEGGSENIPYSFGDNYTRYLNYTMEERIINAFHFGKFNLHAALDILTNIIIFMPMGLLLPTLIKKHNIFITILIGFLVSLLFESFQYFTLFGTCDFFDIVFNTLGTIFGVAIYYVLINVIPSNKLNYVINIVGIVAIILQLGILFYAIYSLISYHLNDIILADEIKL